MKNHPSFTSAEVLFQLDKRVFNFNRYIYIYIQCQGLRKCASVSAVIFIFNNTLSDLEQSSQFVARLLLALVFVGHFPVKFSAVYVKHFPPFELLPDFFSEM